VIFSGLVLSRLANQEIAWIKKNPCPKGKVLKT
jgi:hypothetical protein